MRRNHGIHDFKFVKTLNINEILNGTINLKYKKILLLKINDKNMYLNL